MAVVNFPAGYYLDRATTLEHGTGVEVDFLSDGTPLQRQVTNTPYSPISCSFSGLTQTEKNTLISFLKTNAVNQIVMVIDGVAYIGAILGSPRDSMTGRRYNVTFTYYAVELF